MQRLKTILEYVIFIAALTLPMFLAPVEATSEVIYYQNK